MSIGILVLLAGGGGTAGGIIGVIKWRHKKKKEVCRRQWAKHALQCMHTHTHTHTHTLDYERILSVITALGEPDRWGSPRSEDR